MSAGGGCPRPTRLLADWVAEAVCRSLAAGGVRAEVEVLESHRLRTTLPGVQPTAAPASI
ncbi:hypothetical protein [Streptomyces canus]|uniref:hypothetical protein n=1 Tax=Streptomyces canus TaxID=58343 RepID=UPI00131A33E4|nr:hypothetical protein [Streptomyces canus]